MSDTATIWLPDAQKSWSCGFSLAETLYRIPVTLMLRGELEAGKTTVLQGCARSLGIEESLTSPTFALEQRYQTREHGELLHLDLYRLSPEESRALVAATEDHEGIRCIEWSERLGDAPHDGTIDVTMSEERGGRLLTAIFRDATLPTGEQVQAWRSAVMLPENIRQHCDVVASCARVLAEALLRKFRILRPGALQRAAELHDLLRFMDFGSEAASVEAPRLAGQESSWERWRQRYSGLGHEAACSSFLREQGFPALASIVEVHGFRAPRKPKTIEERLLFYADKRVRHEEIVSVDERFEDLRQRYGVGRGVEERRRLYEETRKTERELFPEGPPL